MHRLPPAQRDLLLTLFDRLGDGSVTLRDRPVLSSRIVVVADELFGGAASGDRLPGTVADTVQALYQLSDPPRTYGDACRTILLGHGAVETRRAEEAELAALTRWEGEVEARRIRAAERKATEEAKAKAARKAARAAKRPAQARQAA